MVDLNPINWNWNQFKAAGRHVVSYVAGGVTIAVTMHFITAQQADGLTNNIGLITDGLTKVATGFAGLIAVLAPIYTAMKAAHSGSPTQEAISLEKAVPGTKVITAPEIAAAAPSPNIVSNTDMKVVQK